MLKINYYILIFSVNYFVITLLFNLYFFKYLSI